LVENQEFIHRIIVITGFNSRFVDLIAQYDFNQAKPAFLAKSWQNFLNSVIASGFPTTYVLNQAKYWPAQSKHHFVRANLAKSFQAGLILEQILAQNNAQIFVSRDCFSQTETETLSKGEMELPLMLATMCAQERVLLDPQKLYLQT
jgi:hypothetical protein